MAAINYLDFDLLIERAEAGYRARVLRCPAIPPPRRPHRGPD